MQWLPYCCIYFENLRKSFVHECFTVDNGKHLFFQALCSFRDFRTQCLCAVDFLRGTKFPQVCFSRHTGRIWRFYAADLRIGISPFSLHMGVVFINTRQKKKTCTGKVQIKICYMRLLHRDSPTAAPTGKTGALQEEVYKASAFRSDCPRYVPMLISARFTWILPTRLPVPIGAWSITPSSSARGTTLAVMASSVSRMLPGQGYSIVTAIAA